MKIAMERLMMDLVSDPCVPLAVVSGDAQAGSSLVVRISRFAFQIRQLLNRVTTRMITATEVLTKEIPVAAAHVQVAFPAFAVMEQGAASVEPFGVFKILTPVLDPKPAMEPTKTATVSVIAVAARRASREPEAPATAVLEHVQ